MKRGRYGATLRVLTILRDLDGARYVSLRTLASQHTVSVRTVRRDLELLERAGCRLPKWRHLEE